VEDRALVELLVAGDPRGLAEVYDTYASRLHAYCTTMLRDRDAAADAVHDTLLVARERVAQLREPDRLRPWLYAIARNECLRALRDRRRTAGLDEAGEMTDEGADLEAGLRAGEMRELVWAAAESLNASEREVLELSVRHGLEGADLADALGVSANHAHALASRARTQLERALAVLIVARTGRQDCAELDAMLGDWDGHLTPLLRKRLSRHLERCDICGEQRRRRVSAAALLAGVPVVAAPPGLRDRILRDAGDMRLVSTWEALATRAGPFLPSGFPVPLQRRRKRLMVGWSAAAAAVAVLLLIAGAVFVLPRPAAQRTAGQLNAAGTTGPASADAGTTDPPSSTVDTTTAPPSTTPAATTTIPPPTTTLAAPPQTTTTPAAPTTTQRTTTPPPRTTTSPPPPPAPTLDASSTADGANCRGETQTWVANLTARLAHGATRSVTATWTDPNGGPHKQGMEQGSPGVWTLSLTLSRFDPDLAWTAATTTSDGQSLSDKNTAANPCPPPPPPGAVG
jgi:RNA polymerase sigma factor (sigma-70 family)